MYNFYGICVLFKSLVLCGVVPRLYTQVSRAEVTMSKVYHAVFHRCHILTIYLYYRPFYGKLEIPVNAHFVDL